MVRVLTFSTHFVTQKKGRFLDVFFKHWHPFVIATPAKKVGIPNSKTNQPPQLVKMSSGTLLLW